MAARTLTVVRHAHAEPARPGQDDADRPLSTRGQREAGLAAVAFARTLNAQEVPLLLTSPSRRTRATAEEFARALGLDPAAVRLDDRLYLASVDALFDVLQGSDDGQRHVVVIGHNPGLSDFVRALSGDGAIADLPPAAVKRFECVLRGWRNLTTSSGKLLKP
jgi:phosphohistidine phosphatase